MKNRIINKNIIKSLLVVVFLFGSVSFAGDWADMIEIRKSDPTKWTDPQGDTYENSYRWSLRIKPFPQEANPIFIYKPAKLEWDCNGVSFEAAFLQYIGFRDIELMLKHASVSFFWGMILALKITLPKIDAVFKAIRKMAQNIRDLLANMCKIGQSFMENTFPGAVEGSRRVQGMVDGIAKYIDKMADPIDAAADQIEDWKKALLTTEDKKGAASKVANAAFFEVFQKASGSIFNAMFSKYNYCNGSGKENVGMWMSTLSDMLWTFSGGSNTIMPTGQRVIYDATTNPSGGTHMGDGQLYIRAFNRVNDGIIDDPCRELTATEKIKMQRKVFVYKIFLFLVGDNTVNELFVSQLYQVTKSIDALKHYMQKMQAGQIANDLLSHGDPSATVHGSLGNSDFQKFLEYGAKESDCRSYGGGDHSPTSNTCFIPDLEAMIYNMKDNKDPALNGPRIRGVMIAIPKKKSEDDVIALVWDGFEAVAYRSVQYMICAELNASTTLGSALSKQLMKALMNEYSDKAAMLSPKMANGKLVFESCVSQGGKQGILELGAKWDQPGYIFINAIGMYPRIKRYLKNIALLLKAREENVASVVRLAKTLSNRLQLVMSVDFLADLGSIIYTSFDSTAFSVMSTTARENLYRKKVELNKIISKAEEGFIKKRENKIAQDGPFHIEYKRVADAVRRVRTQRTIIQGK